MLKSMLGLTFKCLLVGFVELPSNQVTETAVTGLVWHPTLRMLLVLTRDAEIQGWRVHIVQNTNQRFFEPAGGARDCH